jgi:hypothetical protein
MLEDRNSPAALLANSSVDAPVSSGMLFPPTGYTLDLPSGFESGVGAGLSLLGDRAGEYIYAEAIEPVYEILDRATFSASYRADYGNLGAELSVSKTVAADYPFNKDVTASVEVSWSDGVTIEGPGGLLPDEVRLNYDVTGTASVTTPIPGLGDPNPARPDTKASLSATFQLADPTKVTEFSLPFVGNQQLTVQPSVTFALPVENGHATFKTSFSLGVDIVRGSSGLGFGKTMKFSSITLADGSTPESHGYQLRFDSGIRSPNLAEPAPPTISGPALVYVPQVALSGTAEAGSTVRVYDGTTFVGETTAAAVGGNWSYIATGLARGSHSFTVTATDRAGLTSVPSAALPVTVAVFGPSPPTITGPTLTNTTAFTLSGTAQPRCSVAIYDTTSLLGSVTASTAGTWSYTATGQSEGTHSFTATATDALGNTSDPSAPLLVTVDLTAPEGPTITGEAVVHVPSVTLSGSAEPDSTVSVFDGTALLGEAAASASGAWTFLASELASGSHSFFATATDAAGNTSASSTVLPVLVDLPAPNVAITGAPSSSPEGTPINLAASVSVTSGTMTYAWSVSRDGFHASGSDPTFSFTPNDNGSYVVNLSVSDQTGPLGSDSKTITVTNAAPVVIAGADASLAEGATFGRAGSFTDPGTADTWTATVDYGDGSGVQPLALNPDKTFALGHAYLSAGDHPVTVSVIDKDGGEGTGSFIVHVGNGAPTTSPPLTVEPARNLVATYAPSGSAAMPWGIWYVRNSTDPADPGVTSFAYGGVGWKPVAGDWNGDGTATVGVVDTSGQSSPYAVWMLRNSNTDGASDIQFAYGMRDWTPVAGDWNGDGTVSAGVVDLTAHASPYAIWMLRNSNSPGAADVQLVFGLSGWKVVMGDWDGDGIATPGVFDPATATWYLRHSNDPADPGVTVIWYGGAGWTPVAGDWNNDGITSIGVVDPAGIWHLRDSTSAGAADHVFAYGLPGWTPVTGSWGLSGTPLLAGGGRGTGASSLLDQATLDAAVTAALARLTGAGVSPSLLGRLALASWSVFTLPGSSLVASDPAGNRLAVDAGAAGRGWYIDPTPGDDSEFSPGQALPDSGAVGKEDLLSAVLHGLGRLAGLPAEVGQSGTDLMAQVLPAGTRHTDHLDALFASL